MVNVEESLSADLIAQQTFPAARRGFNQDEVRAFLVKVAGEVVALRQHQTTLEQARRDAEYRAAHPSFDEDTLLGAVGQETAQILKSAHEAAADIKTRAGENASRILKEAHQKAEALRAEAETVLARRTEEAEAFAVKIREQGRNEAERLVDQARQQVKAIRSQAEAERNATVEAAQLTRDKILSSLSKKRNIAIAQVEALRAGRERLLSSYEVVKRTLDEAMAELARAEADARGAAASVRHRPVSLDEADGLEDDEPPDPTLPLQRITVSGPVPPTVRPTPAGSPARGMSATATPAGSPARSGPASPPAAPASPVAAPGPAGGPGSAPPVPPVAGQTKAPGPPPAANPPASAVAGAANPPASAVAGAAYAPAPAPAPTSAPASAVAGAAGVLSAAPPAPAGPAAPSTSQAPTPGALPSSPAVPAARPATSAPSPTVAGGTGSGSGSAPPAKASPPGPLTPPPAVGTPGWGAARDASPSAPASAPTSESDKGKLPSTLTPERERSAEQPPKPHSGGDAKSGGNGSVSSLFARMRADRERAVSQAREVLAQDPPPPPLAGPQAPASQDGVTEQSGLDVDRPDRPDRPVPDSDEGWMQRRDGLVGPIEANLTRRLKRALQDDQNDRLDRLRSLRSSQKPASVLADREAHAALFRRVARPFLTEAFAAGVAFTASFCATTEAAAADGERLADALTDAIVEPLRKRLEAVLVGGQGDDPVVLAEAVGAAYREWKTKRIEVAAADHVANGFAAGAYAALPADAEVRWLVDDAAPCPDCDDNALAGGQAKGEAFPTGQRRPPAHPGCRCLLVPAAEAG